MSERFLAPERLLGLLAVVVFAAAYVAALRWRRAATVRFTQLELIDSVIPRRPHWRRHVVAVVNLAGIALGVVAIARPVTTTTERLVSEGRIMVAFDVSSSMSATDVEPTRFEAAQAAATEFLAQVEPDVEVGLLSFSGDITVLTPPTLDRSATATGIERLRLAPSTAIGDALVVATELLVDLRDDAADEVDDEQERAARRQLSPGVIVLLSDGETTAGRSTEQGARVAAAADVPVFTISFGTADGVIVDPRTGGDVPVPVRPEPLRDAAEVTRGQSYEAATADELGAVYAEIRDLLEGALGHEVERHTEFTWAVAGASLLAFALAWALSLWWLRGLV